MNVIISGYFNPMTAGHLEYIKAAKQLGNVYCIVNSDEQVKLKGSIPFLDQETRLQIILPHVHYAVISNWDIDKSVTNTIKRLHDFDPTDKWIFYNSGDVGTSTVNKVNIRQKEIEICQMLGIEIMYGKEAKIASSSSLIEEAAKIWIKRKLNL